MAEGDLHSYRCPFCGHADGIDLRPGESLHLACTHCGNLLEVRLDRGSSERVSVVLKKREN